MDQLLAMRAFIRVVESGGFTRAADSLQMPKGSVSKMIQKLEAQLRVKLLLRTTRKVSVTADGAAYYDRIVRLLSELDDIEARLGNAQASPRGRLRVNVGGTTASLLILPALPAFLARYPDIQVDLGVTDRTVDLIGENVDCVIRSTADDLSLVSRHIVSLPWVTCASPGYLSRHGRPEHPRDLDSAAHRVAGYASARSGRLVPMLFARGDERLEIEGRCVVSVNESHAHAAAGLAGLGVIQTLDFMVRPHLRSGALVPLLTSWTREPQAVYLVYPPNRHLSARLRAFVDWTVSLFEGLDTATGP